eukprot:scaffold815_cov120-Cylindrotheca_fusiformis.AAC.2
MNNNNEHHEDGRNETALVPYDATAQASEDGAIVMLGALQLQFKQFWTVTLHQHQSRGGGRDMFDNNTQDEMLVADHVETTQHRGLAKLYTTEDGRFQLVPETLTFPELTSVSYNNSPYKALKRSD